METSDLHTIHTQLSQSKKIAIVSHYNPDGDAIGSSLALYHFFKGQDYDVQVVIPNPFPDFLKWMPASETILIADQNKTEAKKAISEADLLFVVDMNAPYRSGILLENAIIKSKAFKILIDHHIDPDIESNIMYSFPGSSSTCELIYRFLFNDLHYEDSLLSLDMAKCLYVGIITDTGSLTYSSNDPGTYTILSRLIGKGVDGEKIHRLIYDNYDESRLRLLGLSLSERLTVMPEYATAYIYLSKKDLKDYHYKIGDTEGFVNYGLSMKSVQFAVIFIQRDKRVRISFRSKGNFDVNQFARLYFNGGGHKNASAAYYHDTLENTISYFESLLPKHKEELLKPYHKPTKE